MRCVDRHQVGLLLLRQRVAVKLHGHERARLDVDRDVGARAVGAHLRLRGGNRFVIAAMPEPLDVGLQPPVQGVALVRLPLPELQPAERLGTIR